MSTTNTTKVSILGVEYTLRGDADSERMSQLARYVDEKLNQAKARSGQPQDMARVAILTSLNIAYELFATRAEVEDKLAEVRRRAGDLADRLERCLGDASSRKAVGPEEPTGIPDLGTDATYSVESLHPID